MKTRRFLFLLLIIMAAMLPTAAQQPVRWRTIVKTTGADTGTITFKALITPGWHLYGLDLPEGGPKATSFDLDGSTGIKFTEPVAPVRKAVEVNDPLFGMTLTWWDSNIDFTVPFKVIDPANARLSAKITYMACDGTTCRPPSTENIAVAIKLKSATK